MEVPKRQRDDATTITPPSPPPPLRTATSTNNNNHTDLSLLEALEKSQSQSQEVLDLRTLKKLIISFERRLKENIEARLKYPDLPDRFADSELNLHEELHKLHTLSGAPDLYQSVIENLAEVKPAVSEMVCKKTKLLRWIMGRIKMSEVLAILLQNSVANQRRLRQMNGVDAVLQAVAVYKNKFLKTSDEEEMVENLFNCLCCLLMPLENKERFVKAGVELMIIIMRQKKSAYGFAIRTLDFAMIKYHLACERFVDVWD